MDDFIVEIKALATTYVDDTNFTISTLSVSLAIEKFIDIRNYSSSVTDKQKIADMEKHKNKIAMASVEIESKNGMEGQTSHSEVGTSRTYADNIQAYLTVCCIAKVY